MGWLARLEAFVAGPDSARFATAAAAPTGSATAPAASTWRAQSVAKSVAMSIPAMRRARASLLVPATFGMGAWSGNTRLEEADPRASWLRQPERDRPRFNTLV